MEQQMTAIDKTSLIGRVYNLGYELTALQEKLIKDIALDDNVDVWIDRLITMRQYIEKVETDLRFYRRYKND
jgi:hypothetical protein